MIYFVEAGLGGAIKIGYVTENDLGMVDARVSSLQTGNHEPLRLLVTLPGGLDRERELHARFAEGRIHGEWFRTDTPGLRGFIDGSRAQELETAWQLRDDGLQLCEVCGHGIVERPRRKYCSDRCALVAPPGGSR